MYSYRYMYILFYVAGSFMHTYTCKRTQQLSVLSSTKRVHGNLKKKKKNDLNKKKCDVLSFKCSEEIISHWCLLERFLSSVIMEEGMLEG